MVKTARSKKKPAEKTEAAPNKSAAVRAYLEAHADAKPKEVVEALATQGVTVTPNLVSILKSKGKIAGSGKKLKRVNGKAGSNFGGALSPKATDAALALVEAAGSVDQAQALLTLIGRLKG